jgi:hypothetical protein
MASVIDDGAAITVKRLIGSIRRECLDHVVMFGADPCLRRAWRLRRQ